MPPKLYKKTGSFSTPKAKYRFFFSTHFDNQRFTRKKYRFLLAVATKKQGKNDQILMKKTDKVAIY